MVTQPFSSAIGMSPIGGFKNRFFYFLGQRWLKKIWSPLIDNPFNDDFWTNISIFFSGKRNERWSSKLDGYILGPMLRHPIF